MRKRMFALLLALCLMLPGGALAEDDVARMLGKGAQYEEAGDAEAAEISYRIALQLAPEDEQTLGAMAAFCMRQGRYEDALSYAEQAIAKAPADGELYLLLAEISCGLDRPDDADMALRYAEICDSAPDDALLVRMALCHVNRGRAKRAIELFERADQAAWLEEYALQYAQALVMAGEYDKAASLDVADLHGERWMADVIENGASFQLTQVNEDVDAYPVFCSMAYYRAHEEEALAEGFVAEPTEDGLRTKLWVRLDEALNPGDFSVISLAPFGRAALCDDTGRMYILRNGEVTAVTLNTDRGTTELAYAAKTYRAMDYPGNLGMYYKVVWSPDERYLACTYCSLEGDPCYDLVVVDTQSGDLFVPDGTPKEESSMYGAISACFDERSEHIYYLMSRDVNGERSHELKRYALDTGETESLCVVEGLTMSGLQMYMDWEGFVRAVALDAGDGHAAVVDFVQQDGAWSYTLHPLANERGVQLPWKYLYSEGVGEELMICKAGKRHYLSLSTDPQEERAQNLALVFSNEEEDADLLSVEALLERGLGNADVTDAAISPGGRFVLVEVCWWGEDGENVTREYGLFMVDLYALSSTQVLMPEGIEPHDINTFVAGRSMNRLGMADNISWVSNNLIAIHTDEGRFVFSIEGQ